ncbi:MAG: arylesterase [Desulfobacteraceae bacterium]
MVRGLRLLQRWGFKICMGLCTFIVWGGCNADPPVIEKAQGPKKRSQAFEGTIAAVGDSLTAGFGVDEQMAYPARLERKLQAAGYNYQVINAGVSGETSSGARSRIEWVLSALDPDIVILETGANDGLRGIDPKLLETNLDQICTILKENKVHVLLAGMQMLPNLGPEYTEAFSTIFARVAEKHQVVLMPFFLKDVAGENGLNQPDRIHPTGQGYARITDNIYPYVLETIERYRNSTGGAAATHR